MIHMAPTQTQKSKIQDSALSGSPPKSKVMVIGVIAIISIVAIALLYFFVSGKYSGAGQAINLGGPGNAGIDFSPDDVPGDGFNEEGLPFFVISADLGGKEAVGVRIGLTFPSAILCKSFQTRPLIWTDSPAVDSLVEDGVECDDVNHKIVFNRAILNYDEAITGPVNLFNVFVRDLPAGKYSFDINTFEILDLDGNHENLIQNARMSGLLVVDSKVPSPGVDTDGDDMIDSVDTDDDNDGILDSKDQCPLDADYYTLPCGREVVLEPVLCKNDLGCNADEMCVNNVCTAKPVVVPSGSDCKTDLDCLESEICSNSKCVAAPVVVPWCKVDTDCADGASCIAGNCEGAYPMGQECVDDSECGEFDSCQNGNCLPYEEPLDTDGDGIIDDSELPGCIENPDNQCGLTDCARGISVACADAFECTESGFEWVDGACVEEGVVQIPVQNGVKVHVEELNPEGSVYKTKLVATEDIDVPITVYTTLVGADGETIVLESRTIASMRANEVIGLRTDSLGKDVRSKKIVVWDNDDPALWTVHLNAPFVTMYGPDLAVN